MAPPGVCVFRRRGLTIRGDMKRLIIAIDGPSAAGKSTAGKGLAARLGYLYIDTGAMYRAVGWKAIQEGVDLDDDAGLEILARGMEITLSGDPGKPVVIVDGRDVTTDIRTPAVDVAASKVSVVAGVRAAMVDQQRAMGRDGGVVLDGRDIGTHVFPNADLKFFLLADPSVRALRRHDENVSRGRDESLEQTMVSIAERDKRDSTRATAPLIPATDAVLIDTSLLSRDELVERMVEVIAERLAPPVPTAQ